MITPELDSTHVTNGNIDKFRSLVRHKLDSLLKDVPANANKSIIINLSSFEAINDSGLAELIRAKRQAERRNRAKITFEGINPRVREKIFIKGLEQPLGIT